MSPVSRALALLLTLVAALAPAVAAGASSTGTLGGDSECCCASGERVPMALAKQACCCAPKPATPPTHEPPVPQSSETPHHDLVDAQHQVVAVLPALNPERAAPRPALTGVAPPVRQRLGVWLL